MTVQNHEIYDERYSLLWFWLLSYAGGEYMRSGVLTDSRVRRLRVRYDQPVTINDVLWRFRGEKEAEFNDRVDRAHYERQAGAALDAIVAGVLSGVGEPSVPDKLAPMLMDVDGKGTPWAEWRIQQATWAGCSGHVHVGADLPTPGGIDRAKGLPYLYLINPIALTNWSLDQWGDWTMARVKETVSAGEPPDEDGRTWKAGSVRYRQWTRETVTLLDENGNPRSEMPNPFRFVPIETVYYTADPIYSHERIGRAWMESPARRNQHLYNVHSWIDQIAFRITFPMLAVPVPEGESSVSPEQQKAVGVEAPFAYPQGGSPPSWLSPPRESIDVLRDLAKEDIRAIRQMAGLSSPEQPGGNEMPSGEALRQLRANLGALLGGFARQLQGGDERVLKMAARIMGANPDQVEVSYPDDYADVDDTVKLEEAQRALDAGLEGVPTANAMILESVLRTVLPSADAKQLEKAVAEIHEQAKDELENPTPDPPPFPPQFVGQRGVKEPEDDDDEEPGKPPQGKPEDRGGS